MGRLLGRRRLGRCSSIRAGVMNLEERASRVARRGRRPTCCGRWDTRTITQTTRSPNGAPGLSAVAPTSSAWHQDCARREGPAPAQQQTRERIRAASRLRTPTAVGPECGTASGGRDCAESFNRFVMSVVLTARPREKGLQRGRLSVRALGVPAPPRGAAVSTRQRRPGGAGGSRRHKHTRRLDPRRRWDLHRLSMALEGPHTRAFRSFLDLIGIGADESDWALPRFMRTRGAALAFRVLKGGHRIEGGG